MNKVDLIQRIKQLEIELQDLKDYYQPFEPEIKRLMAIEKDYEFVKKQNKAYHEENKHLTKLMYNRLTQIN